MNADVRGPGPASRDEIGIVVVTYHPVGELGSRLGRMAAQGRSLVVVDNGSDAGVRNALAEFCQRPDWQLISNPDNLGLGAALNQGVRLLHERGFRWAILFDQDSEPAVEMSQAMIETWRRHPAATRLAIVGPRFVDRSTGRVHRVLRPHPRWPFFFQKTAIGAEDLPEVTMVITSGSLLRVADFLNWGPFDEGFFIDHIDTDFCLRCRSHGRLIAMSARAQLDHSLGSRKVHTVLGLKAHPTHHSASRHYYIARNRISMIRRYATREWHWLWFEMGAAGLWLFRVLLFEAGKLAKLRGMLWGTWDGLRGVQGKCLAAHQRKRKA